MRHYVHIYASVRVKIAVDADSHAEAIAAATDHFSSSGHALLNRYVRDERQVTETPQVVHTEYADDISGYLVDEAGDDDFQRTRNYEANGEPVGPAAPSAESEPERPYPDIFGSDRDNRAAFGPDWHANR
jgi:hypothetical protein